MDLNNTHRWSGPQSHWSTCSISRDRVSFVAGDLRAVTAPVGDAYYFFNPFGEYWLGADYPTEADADVTGTRWADDIAAAEDLLRSVPAGTWILTYNGFGGRMPAGYELVRVDWKLAGVLRLWRKRLDTARIGSPRMMKTRSRARLALASRSARARASSERHISGC